MRAGAEAMDEHFQQAPFASNAPIQLALAGLRALAAPGDVSAAVGNGVAGQAGRRRRHGRGRADGADHLGHAGYRWAAHVLPVAAPERRRCAGGLHRQPARPYRQPRRTPHAAGQLPGPAAGAAARQVPGAGAPGRGAYRRPGTRAQPGAAHGASGRTAVDPDRPAPAGPAGPGRAAGLVRAQSVRAERGLGHQPL
ncbi:hypothetical protein G6F65_019199 [Rhizopus arrhizus]|nr:hypothetical protein G6F65_019199 [Rhizopus arrhizus]